jgi:hypothetical protein
MTVLGSGAKDFLSQQIMSEPFSLAASPVTAEMSWARASCNANCLFFFVRL